MAACGSCYDTGAGGYVLLGIPGNANVISTRLGVKEWSYNVSVSFDDVTTSASTSPSPYGNNYPGDQNDCPSPTYNRMTWKDQIVTQYEASGTIEALWCSNNNSSLLGNYASQ